jgi:hypothetical protein
MDAYFFTEDTTYARSHIQTKKNIRRSDVFTAQDASDVAVIDLQAIKTM